MAILEWYDEETLCNEGISVFEQAQTNKVRKRRWREIEVIKETRRLKRELAQLNVNTWF